MPASAPSPALQVFLKEHLLYVHTKAEAGEYADAMAALQETKASIKDNIYVRAVEQQLLTLLDLSRRNILTDERRTEILDPITGIIERAIGTIHHAREHVASPAQQPAQSAAPPTLGADEKQAALDKLKVQYFEQAGRHLSNGEYSLALAEIHRVFVIDPENATAKQYESIIHELMNMKGAAAPTSEQPALEPPPVDVATIEETVEDPPSDHAPQEIPEPEPQNEEATSAEEEPAVPDEPAPVEPLSGTPPAEVEEPEITTAATLPELRPTVPPRVVEPRHIYSHVREAQEENLPQRSSKRRIALGSVLVVLVAAVASFFLFFNGPSTRTADPGVVTQLAPVQQETNADSPTADASPSTKSEQTPPLTSSSNSSTPTATENRQPSGTSAKSGKSEPVGPATSEPPAKRTKDQGGENRVQPVVSEEESRPSVAAALPITAAGTTTPTQNQAVTVAEPEPEPFIAVEKDPQLVKLQSPEIPDVAWGASSDAQIILRVLIDADGKPVKAKVLKGDNPLIQTAAVNAVMKSTFTPGVMGKAPVTAWLTLPLKFHRNN